MGEVLVCYFLPEVYGTGLLNFHPPPERSNGNAILAGQGPVSGRLEEVAAGYHVRLPHHLISRILGVPPSLLRHLLFA